MSRCVACNALLSSADLRINKEDNTPEDMCCVCRGGVPQWDDEVGDWYDESDHEYQFQDVTEGVKSIVNHD